NGYNENKTVKFSLRGTKEGDAPFEFIWSDDTTEEKSVILKAGENSVDCPVNLKSTSYFGVVGVTAGIYDGQDDIESDYEAENEMPEDTDNDLMADSWEKQYLDCYNYTDIEEFKPRDDLENEPEFKKTGDYITNLEEYRGYSIYSRNKVFIRNGFRFDPTKREVFIRNALTESYDWVFNYLTNNLDLKTIAVDENEYPSKADKYDYYCGISTVWELNDALYTKANGYGNEDFESGKFFVDEVDASNIARNNFGELRLEGTFTLGHNYPKGIDPNMTQQMADASWEVSNVYTKTIDNLFVDENRLPMDYSKHSFVKKVTIENDLTGKVKTIALTYSSSDYANVVDLMDYKNDGKFFALPIEEIKRFVLLHEIGHSLRLDHKAPPSIMVSEKGIFTLTKMLRYFKDSELKSEATLY
ncbi:MAG: hypothetical protein KAR20_22080, partial [Candidatus Heimdallarchaeota archaeon]|nr:hypothetical protein [Candidatus Heimdallarchaeota archaeon]